MDEPHKIDVTYAGSRWLANVDGYNFNCRGLSHLTNTVQRLFPGKAFIFAVNRTSIEGEPDAEKELLEATSNGGAPAIMIMSEP